MQNIVQEFLYRRFWDTQDIPGDIPGKDRYCFHSQSTSRKEASRAGVRKEKKIREWQQTRDNLVNLIVLVFCRTFII